MAKTNTNSSSLVLNLLPLLFVLSIIIIAAASTAESRLIFGIGFGKQTSPVCDEVYGAKKGDSCFTVIEKFKLTSEFFGALNPNLNCTNIFVNQWLCVDGFVN